MPNLFSVFFGLSVFSVLIRKQFFVPFVFFVVKAVRCYPLSAPLG
jgi:hypothetical protein